MEYKYKGETYVINLNDEGKIEGEDINGKLIVSDSPEDVKKQIRAAVKDIEEAETYSVLIKEYGREIYSGTTKLKAVGGRYSRDDVWVSYEGSNGKSKRRGINRIYLYLDNPHNLDIVKQIEAVDKEIEALEEKRRALSEDMLPFFADD